MSYAATISYLCASCSSLIAKKARINCARARVNSRSACARCRGDRLRPAGMKGRRKKLQDLFVDRKIAREERDAVPLVVDREDRILWVVGHAVAEDFRVTEPLQGVLLLKARRLGGLG